MIFMPNISMAATKTLSLTTFKQSVSTNCNTYLGTVKGGAMSGGSEGIKYEIEFAKPGSAYYKKDSGECEPNTSFSKVYQSKNGVVNLKVTLAQKSSTKESRCVGWARIDYY